MANVLGSLAGSMLGGLGDLVGTFVQRDWQKDDLQDARADAFRRQQETDALQREFAQMGIQWRVQDAINAGLHPLFALGGGVQGYSPTVGIATGGAPPEFPKMGQNLSRAAMSSQDAEMKELLLENQRLQNDKLLMEVYGKDATGNYWNVISGQGGDVTIQGQPNRIGRPGEFDRFTFKPAEVESSSSNDPSQVAGPASPHWQTFILGKTERGDSFPIDMPSKEVTERWESIGESASLWMIVTMRNIQKYGKQWWEEFERTYPGRAALALKGFMQRRQFGPREFEGPSNMP